MGIIDLIKFKISKVGLRLLKHIPDNTYLSDLEKKLYMSTLYRSDRVLWRVEKARELGAKVGDNCRFYSLNFFSEPYLIEIGSDVIISGNVIFLTHDGGVYLLKEQIPNIRGSYGKIKIGNNCFIGMGSIILPNIEIGNNCIIGAGSVVTKNFPDNSVIMGNPASVIFKTSVYLKMKKYSKFTVTNNEYPFPTTIPEKEKRKMLEEHFKNIQIRNIKVKE